MIDFDETGVPSADLTQVTGEESLKNFMDIVQELKAKPWDSRLNDILDAFEDFLTIRPEPPQSWQDTYAASGKEFDYYQVVLPEDFQDPYEDDLGNINRLRGEFARVPSTMALEHELISRNYFILKTVMPRLSLHRVRFSCSKARIAKTMRNRRKATSLGIAASRFLQMAAMWLTISTTTMKKSLVKISKLFSISISRHCRSCN